MALPISIFLVVDMILRSLGHEHGHGPDKKKDDHHHHADHKQSSILLNMTADALHRFDGTSFSPVAAPTPDTYRAIHGSSFDNVWVVGHASDTGGDTFVAIWKVSPAGTVLVNEYWKP